MSVSRIILSNLSIVRRSNNISLLTYQPYYPIEKNVVPLVFHGSKVLSATQPQVTNITRYSSKKDEFNGFKFSSHHDFKEKQNKKANLGKLIEELKILLPNVLQKSLPKDIISKEILLRICPTYFEEFNAYLPALKGHVSYYTTLKTLQVVLTSVVLNPNVRLHLQNIKVLNPNESTREFQCVDPNSTKIYIRWTTCGEGCHHLHEQDSNTNDDNPRKYQSTSDARLGSHSWLEVDTSKFTQLANHKSDGGKSLPSLGKTITHLTTGLIGLVKEKNRLERVISGIFIFELNDDNSEIVVHTLENIDIIEKSDPQELTGLRIC